MSMTAWKWSMKIMVWLFLDEVIIIAQSHKCHVKEVNIMMERYGDRNLLDSDFNDKYASKFRFLRLEACIKA